MKVLFGDTIFYAFDLRRGSLFTWSWRSREDPEDLAAFILCKKESFSLRPAQGFDFKTLSIESGIEAASLQLCGQALYRLRLAVEKMYFQQEKDQPWTLGMNLICTVPRPHLPGLTLICPGHSAQEVWIYSEFIKVCWIHFSSWESLIGFYIWCYPISTIPECLFTFRVRISWKKLCWKGSMAAKIPSYASYTLCIILYEGWIWSNYHWKIRLSTKDNNN